MNTDLNKSLRYAIESHNVGAVKQYLEDGADPNHFHSYGEDDRHQPTTPLRLVMFCISDSLLNDDDLDQFGKIARMLIKHGAHPKPAMELAEIRYGKYQPNAEPSPFMNVWRIVATAI